MKTRTIDIGKYFMMTIWGGYDLMKMIREWDYVQRRVVEEGQDEYRAIVRLDKYFFVTMQENYRASDVVREFRERRKFLYQS